MHSLLESLLYYCCFMSVVIIVSCVYFSDAGSIIKPASTETPMKVGGGNATWPEKYVIYNTTVYWTGGEVKNCSETCSPNHTKVNGFACNSAIPDVIGSKGNWSDGIKSFMSPKLEAQQIVVQVNITLYGRFHCLLDAFTPTQNIFTVTLAESIVAADFYQFNSKPCISCVNCVESFEIESPIFKEGWPFWNKEQENLLQVQVIESLVCLHSAFISMMVADTSPPPKPILPPWAVALLIGTAIGSVVCAIFVVIIAGCRYRTKSRHHSGGSRTQSSTSLPTTYLNAGNNIQIANIHTPLLNSGSVNSTIQDIGKPEVKWQKVMELQEIIVGSRIGKGSFGEVYKGLWKGCTEVAIKKLPGYWSELDEMDEQKTAFLEDFVKETELMRNLRHPNVVQLYAVFTEPEVCMVMEYMHRGSLYQILHSTNHSNNTESSSSSLMTWDVMRRIMLDAAKGMTYLHNSRPVIIHRDLKSHNLLIDTHWRTKVSDFGLSRILTEVGEGTIATMTSCGTPAWTAPEVLRGEKYTEKCDVYSFGIVLWECVTRENPHHGIPHFQIVFQVGTQGLRPKIPQSCPHAWSKLIVDCWAEDVESRPDFETIIDRLNKF